MTINSLHNVGRKQVWFRHNPALPTCTHTFTHTVHTYRTHTHTHTHVNVYLCWALNQRQHIDKGSSSAAIGGTKTQQACEYKRRPRRRRKPNNVHVDKWCIQAMHVSSALTRPWFQHGHQSHLGRFCSNLFVTFRTTKIANNKLTQSNTH